MHAVVMDSLEEYLADALEPAKRRAVEAHLNACDSCREEVGSMQEMSLLFDSLRTDEVVDLPAGFCASVLQKIDGLKPAPTFSGLFALDFAFGRRLVFASLVTLAVLGGFIATREARDPVGPSPEAIMAQQEAPAFDSAATQDNMLVTMTAYEQH